jgi:hypothetical protein
MSQIVGRNSGEGGSSALCDELWFLSWRFQPHTDGISSHRLPEEVALALVTRARTRQFRLLLSFNAFGDYCYVEAGTENGDGANDRLGVTLVSKIADKRLVDFDLIEREFAQIIERRVACPSRKSYPRVLMMQPGQMGVTAMVPHRWIARGSGASLSSDKCVRVSL